MLKVSRRKNESFESLFRRFSRRMQLSGRTIQAKKIRFFASCPNKTARRSSALRRLGAAATREYMLRTGQLKEEPVFGGQKQSK